MVVKVVATPCLQWSPTAMASKKRAINDGILACRSAWLGTMSSKLYRTQISHLGAKQRTSHSTIRRAISASFDSLSDEEFSRKIQDLAIRFQLSDEDDGEKIDESQPESDSAPNASHDARLSANREAKEPSMEAPWLEIHQEPPDWAASIEMKANSVGIPLSLRMIKQKIKNKQWQEGFIEAGESAYCSVKKAFSSMVFIIRELHSYTLQMRELLFYEDLQWILARVQKEMHASFVWLFQQVFSHTPVLMVQVMILLANFTVHSMSTSAAIAAIPPPVASVEISTTTTTVSNKFDSPSIKSSLPSSGGCKTTSVGGSNGGGSNTRPVANGMDGEGWAHRWDYLQRPIVPDGVSPFTTQEEEPTSLSRADEMEIWNSIVDEASRMQAEVRDEALDHETVQQFVSPVTANIDAADEYEPEKKRNDGQGFAGVRCQCSPVRRG